MGYPPTREGELWAAAQAGDARIVHSLLRVGTDPSKHVDPRAGSTALHEALAGGHAAVARVLLEACTPELLHWRDSHGRTPLLALAAGRAAADGDEIGLDVSSQPSSVDSVEGARCTSAHSTDPFAQVAEELLRKDADPNARALDGTTAVHSAAKQGKRELLRMLAKHGASFHVRDRHGREPLAYVTDDATERFMLQLIATIAVEPQTKQSKAITTSWHRTNPGPPQQQQLEVHKDGRYGAAEEACVREHTKKQVCTGSRLPAPPRAPPPPAPGKMPVKSMWPKSLQSDPMTRELTAAEMRRAEYMSIYLSATGITASGQPKEANKPIKSVSTQTKQSQAQLKATQTGSSLPREKPLTGEQPSEAKQRSKAARGEALQQRLVKAFLAADTDGSGTVSKRELFAAMERAKINGVSSSACLRLFQQADVDQNGRLTFEQFSKLALRLQPLLEGSAVTDEKQHLPSTVLSKKTRAQLRKTFAEFDTDASGWISLAELSAALRRSGMFVSDSQLRRMFEEADVDHSGGIDFDEFEALAQRVLMPSAHPERLPGEPPLPPPSSGSAISQIFSAFEKEGTGLIAASSLPRALKLLEIDPEFPSTKRTVQEAAKDAKGVFDRESFGILVHRLITHDYVEELQDRAMAPAPGTASSFRRKSLKSNDDHQLASAQGGEDSGDQRERLARAFVLAPSQEQGSIAAQDVPEVLWQSGFVKDKKQLDSLRPNNVNAMKRVYFEEILSIAEGSGSADVASDAAAGALRIEVRSITLDPSILRIPNLGLFSLVIRVTTPSTTGEGAMPVVVAPFLLRSASFQPRPGSIKLGLEALLPAGTSLIQFELLHEPLVGAGFESIVARYSLDAGSLYSASYALSYTLPLTDMKMVSAGSLDLYATRPDKSSSATAAAAIMAAAHEAEGHRVVAAASVLPLEQPHPRSPPESATVIASLQEEISSLRFKLDKKEEIEPSLKTSSIRRRPTGPSGAVIAAEVYASGKHSEYATAEYVSKMPDWRCRGAEGIQRAAARVREKREGVRHILTEGASELMKMGKAAQAEFKTSISVTPPKKSDAPFMLC